MKSLSSVACILTCFVILAGCQRSLYEPEAATRAYPRELHRPVAIDVQVFRESEEIVLQNATPSSFENFDLWLNQRFVKRIEALPAGERIRVSLWGFFDERGEAFDAGGLWRVERPTPLLIAEIQPGPEEPMIGLITVRKGTLE